MVGIVMFFAALVLLVVGYPVAFTFGSVALLFGGIAVLVELASDFSFLLFADEFVSMFSMMPFRIYSIMTNTILMAIPLFILMGIVLQKSELAERLLESMGILFGKVRGGLAISTVLAGCYRRLSRKVVLDASLQTVKITAMVFAILIGATAFSMVFVYTGADYIVEDFMMALPGEKWGFLGLSMISIMILGFFIDFIEISYIVVPTLLPIVDALGLNPLWFAILIATNLQTSFLSPPFGFSLFYLKGVSPPGVETMDIYRGVIPFIIIQMMVLASIVFIPGVYGL